MAIRFFDMFAGIGGFRSGLEAVGGFECVGHCEIDKYANQAYNLGGAQDFNSAVEKITGKTLFTINPPPEYGQQILTLSTCYDSAHNGRLLVLAAKK